MKRCCRCAEFKNENQFHKCSWKKDRLNSHCKECSRELHKIYYEKNREKILAYTKIYTKTHREKRKKQAERYRLKYKHNNLPKRAE